MKIAKVALKDYVPSGNELKPLLDVFQASDDYLIERVDDTLTCAREGRVVWQTHVSAAKWWTPLVESAPVQAVANVAAAAVAAVGPSTPNTTVAMTAPVAKSVETYRHGKRR